MRIKYIVLLILVLITGALVFRKAILHDITKDWEQESFVYESKDFKFDMAINLSKGCAKRGIEFYGDTVMIYNFKLNEIVLFLTQKNINSCEFTNPVRIPKNSFNFSYYPKGSTVNYKLHKNEILDKLSGEFNFDYHYDSIRVPEYVTKLVDKEKLKQKKVSEKIGKFRLGRDYIEFIGNDLDEIFRAFNFSVKGQIFENTINDLQSYSFKIPSLEREKILMYFESNLGIEFEERKMKTERLIVNFE